MRKAVKGFEGLYEVDTEGNIYSLRKNLIMRPNYISNGYAQYSLRKDGKRHLLLGHRIVANAFIPNEKGLPIINHIDENKKNNRVSNLEWCTYSYNIRASSSHKAAARKRLGEANKGGLAVRKKCEQLTKDGTPLRAFKSVSEASRCTGVNLSNISQACLGSRCTAGGYRWRFKED